MNEVAADISAFSLFQAVAVFTWNIQQRAFCFCLLTNKLSKTDPIDEFLVLWYIHIDFVFSTRYEFFPHRVMKSKAVLSPHSDDL